MVGMAPNVRPAITYCASTSVLKSLWLRYPLRWRELAVVAFLVTAVGSWLMPSAMIPRTTRNQLAAWWVSGTTADFLVQQLGLNSTQALLLDVTRLRAYLSSDMWQDQLARASRLRTSRGIVIPAGGRDYLLNSLVSVRYLRGIGCRLPVEIVYFGPQEIGSDERVGDASSTRKVASALMREPGVMLVDGFKSANLTMQAKFLPHQRLAVPTSFGKKVWAAAYATSFREILLLDSDSLPLLDPTPLFDAPDYVDAGSMFWPDYWHKAGADAALWNVLGLLPPWQRDEYVDRAQGDGNDTGARRWRHRLVESGQLLIDRVRHADVLEFAWMLNGPNRNVVYKAIYGDKDTWRLAFDLADKSGGGYRPFHTQQKKKTKNPIASGWFYLVPHMARDAMSGGPVGHAHRWHHIAMIHAAPRGVPSVLEAAFAAARGGAQVGAKDASVQDLKRKIGSWAEATGGLARSGGWPLFLHRTAPSTKFFPYCARRPDDELIELEKAAVVSNGKLSFPYCRPTHVTVPFSEEQAIFFWKPGMFAFGATDVDNSTAFVHCLARLASSAGIAKGDAVTLAPMLLADSLPETRCALEGMGERGKIPIHIFKIDDAWTYAANAIDISMDVYWQVRQGFWE